MIKIDGSAFRKSIRAARKRLASLVLKAVRRAAELTRTHAKASKLFKDRTHKLRRSIQAPLVVGGTNPAALVDVTSKHAAWIEYGNGFRTNADYIYPKKHPFLVFTVDGRKIVTRRVRTSKPRPFMAEARKSAEPVFQQMCVDAINNMFG